MDATTHRPAPWTSGPLNPPALPDWARLGARVRRLALLAATTHLALLAGSTDERPTNTPQPEAC